MADHAVTMDLDSLDTMKELATTRGIALNKLGAAATSLGSDLRILSNFTVEYDSDETARLSFLSFFHNVNCILDEAEAGLEGEAPDGELARALYCCLDDISQFVESIPILCQLVTRIETTKTALMAITVTTSVGDYGEFLVLD